MPPGHGTMVAEGDHAALQQRSTLGQPCRYRPTRGYVLNFVVPVPVVSPGFVTVASAHHVPAERAVNVNAAVPVVPVVPVPEATVLPVHEVPEKTSSATAALATGEFEDVAWTLRATW